MSFYKKYELERLIADGEAKTFRAMESATGRSVFLHLFNPGGRALLADLKAKLTGPGGKVVAPLLETGEFAGSQYAVTESSEPFSSLREWVSRLPERAPAPQVAPPAPAPRPPVPPVSAGPPGLLDEEPGEFTRVFANAKPAEKPTEPSRPPAAAGPSGLLDDAAEFHQPVPPTRPAGAALPGSAAEEMGDFTRAFGGAPPKAPERVRAPVRLPSIPPVPPPVPPRPAAPPPAPPRREPPPMPGASADTGEFTKLFGSGLSGEAIDIAGEQAKAARTTVNENRPFQKAGEFTRIFGPEMGGEASDGPPASAPLSLNTSASGVFGSLAEVPKPAKGAGDAPKLPESQSDDPGEYTRVFGAKPAQPEAPKPPEARKPGPVIPIAARKPAMKPAAIVGIVAAVLVLLGLIAFAVVLSQRSH